MYKLHILFILVKILIIIYYISVHHKSVFHINISMNLLPPCEHIRLEKVFFTFLLSYSSHLYYPFPLLPLSQFTISWPCLSCHMVFKIYDTLSIISWSCPSVTWCLKYKILITMPGNRQYHAFASFCWTFIIFKFLPCIGLHFEFSCNFVEENYKLTMECKQGV